MSGRQVYSQQLRKIVGEVDRISGRLVKISRALHAYPELGLQEYQSSKLLASELKKNGFHVQQPVAEMETAFKATFKGKPGGPTLAVLAEYDALPEIGHACGHNLIATMALGAGLALSKIMPEVNGTLLVLGTPDEEGSGGKVTMIEHGIFRDVDAAMMIHPGTRTQVIAEALAISHVDIKFKGKAAHAAGSPEKGINALDAVIQTFNSINALRQHLRSDVRIHGVITDGGKRPNIVPETAAASFYVRATDRRYKDQVIQKLKRCAQGAAEQTGAKLEFKIGNHPLDAIKNNPILVQRITKHLRFLGERVKQPDPSRGKGSTDMGNVTQVVPSIHPHIAIAPASVAGHSREFAVASISKRGHEAMIIGAKVMALTCVDLFTNPRLMTEARRAFRTKRSK